MRALVLSHLVLVLTIDGFKWSSKLLPGRHGYTPFTFHSLKHRYYHGDVSENHYIIVEVTIHKSPLTFLFFPSEKEVFSKYYWNLFFFFLGGRWFRLHFSCSAPHLFSAGSFLPLCDIRSQASWSSFEFSEILRDSSLHIYWLRLILL